MSDYVRPEDIMKWAPEAILQRLPVKTLLRFRCICKSWKEVIDSRSFVQQHLAVQKRQLLLKYEHETEISILDPCNPTSVEALSIPWAFAETTEDSIVEPFRLVGTLYGVVCLYQHLTCFTLWNPSMRTFNSINLPPPESLDFDWDCGYFHHQLPYMAFWIDLSGPHFKMLALNLDSRSGVLYSTMDEIWEVLHLDEEELGDLGADPDAPAVIVGRSAYWITEHDRLTELEEEGLYIRPCILSFDFAQESASTIQLPGYHQNYRYTHYPVLCVLQDALALAYWQDHSDSCDVSIWNEVDGVWLPLYACEIPLDPNFRVRWVMGETEDDCSVIVETGSDLMHLGATILKFRDWDYATLHAAYGFMESLLC